MLKVVVFEGETFKELNVEVCYQLVIKWIRKAALQIEGIKDNFSPGKNKIPVLEMDELYTYVKKNRIKSEYGLLLIVS